MPAAKKVNHSMNYLWKTTVRVSFMLLCNIICWWQTHMNKSSRWFGRMFFVLLFYFSIESLSSLLLCEWVERMNMPVADVLALIFFVAVYADVFGVLQPEGKYCQPLKSGKLSYYNYSFRLFLNQNCLHS